MRQTLIVAIALCLLASAKVTNGQELLFNGNLDLTYAQVIVDNDPPGAGDEDFFLPKPLGWVNEGSRAITGPYEDEMSSEPWAGPSPTPVTTDGNMNDPHPDGCGGPDCGVFFKAFSGNTANGPATGHLYQDNPATPGLKYVMTGWAGAEPNFLAAGAELALEFIDGGGTVIPGSGQVIDLLPTLYIANGENYDYKQYMAMAVAPANATSVRVRASMIGGMPNPLGGSQAFVVDDFSLVAVPEPASMALCMIGALGAMGLVRRR